MELEELIGRSLEGFSVKKMTELYIVNEDGKKMKSVGFFQDGNIAKAFAQNQPSPEYYQTGENFVLTDGKVGFVVNNENITLMNDEKTALEIREKALAKLSLEERAILQI